MSEVKTQEFRQASARVLANAKLQSFMSRSMGTFDGARAEAIEEISPQRWEELREQGREIKRHTLDNLDYYLELLRERVIENGGHVHFAKDADEARAIVGRIAQTRGLKLAIKSKSMVSEEMGLNPFLEDMGVEPVETDLGEYIIQLANETPFHIIAPAMHKSKEEVSELFGKKIGRPNLKDIESMAGAAREVLAGEAGERRHGHHGRQLPSGGDGHGDPYYKRGQRTVLHLRAAGPGVHNGHGEDSAIHGRPAHLHSAAAPGGHGPAHQQLRNPRLRPEAVRR